MKVNRLYTKNFLRNYDYILTTSCGKTIVIDPSSPSLLEQSLKGVDYYLITHAHPDHIAGLKHLQASLGGEVVADECLQGKLPTEITHPVRDGQWLCFDRESLRVISIPGHVDFHLGFILQEQERETAVFLGDTVFNGGVGNTRDGDVHVLYQTFWQKILPLCGDLVLYPEHDYWETNLEFTLSLEPENQRAQELLHRYREGGYRQTGHFPATTLTEERAYNLFFRLHLPSVRAAVTQQANLLVTCSTEELFVGLRGLRDRWS